MSIWFEGDGDIRCTLQSAGDDLGDLGAHFVGVVSLMPGVAAVELVDEAPGIVTIRTNEGIMTRTNITVISEGEALVLEFDEKYEARSKVTATSHFRHAFTATERGLAHRLVISDVEATGLLGFFYRRFGSSRMGNAFLKAYKERMEAAAA